MLDANDAYNENAMAEEGKRKREIIRRRLRKKRVKFRGKLKVRKVFQMKELEEERETIMSSNEIKFQKNPLTSQKRSYPREAERWK
jgi:hypothetical protein